jgi:hypothetical protein
MNLKVHLISDLAPKDTKRLEVIFPFADGHQFERGPGTIQAKKILFEISCHRHLLSIKEPVLKNSPIISLPLKMAREKIGFVSCFVPKLSSEKGRFLFRGGRTTGIFKKWLGFAIIDCHGKEAIDKSIARLLLQPDASELLATGDQ